MLFSGTAGRLDIVLRLALRCVDQQAAETHQGITMKYPIRNLIYEKIRQAGNMTDSDLMNALTKEGVTIADSEFNKTLLDLEIYGLVRVTWVTKDKRRIELVADAS